MNNIILAGWIVAVLTGGMLFYAHYQFARDAHWFRLYSIRFPMFAVRDQLLGLVATGKMSTDNTAWASAYRTANALLRFSRRINAFSVIRDRIRFEKRLRNDTQEANRARRIDEALESESKRLPEFHNILHDMNVAAWTIVSYQTSRVERLLIWFFNLVNWGFPIHLHRTNDDNSIVSSEIKGSGQTIGTCATLIEYQRERRMAA